MGKKPDFDLSNVGGKPKDWFDRASQRGEDDWWQDVKMLAGILVPVAVLALCAVSFAYAIFKFRS